MGVCESEKVPHNFIKIDGQIKDISNESLLDDSIQESIKDKYTIEQKIGKGSFGKVYFGKDEFGEKCAIKCIKKKNIKTGELLLNEVNIGVKMNHPNILGIKKVYEDKKTISLVMEYCDGGDLLTYITNSPGGKLDDIKTIEIIIQILEGLNYLHNEVGICHRDLKPENCLIVNKGENGFTIKLIDFGVAQYINKGHRIRGQLGSSAYMAPEIITKPFYNEKIDVWSAGIILYNMTTGCEPFKELKKLKAKYLINREVDFDIIKNKYIRELCQGMLEILPHKRFDAKTALEKAKIFYGYMINQN